MPMVRVLALGEQFVIDMNDVSEQLNKLKDQRAKLALEKKELETNLAAIRNLVRSSGRMPHEKYKACCDSQTNYSRKIVGVESKLIALKREIQILADQDHAQRQSNSVPVREVVSALREVRDRWQEFSADESLGTSPQRTQAAQFVRDLNPIIHWLLDPKAERTAQPITEDAW